MITSINASNGFIITSSFGSSGPYLSDNTNDPSHGLVRYRQNRFEIYDGFAKSWIPHYGESIQLGLDARVNFVLDWAEKKMAEETREKELLEKHPALQKAKENYDIIRKLVENE